MAQLTARQAIQHHIGVLCGYLESVPTLASETGDADTLIAEYAALVDGFWDEYTDLAPEHGRTYYWTFIRATGEENLRALAYYGQDMWPGLAKELAGKMKAQSVDVLYLLTDEAGTPPEYLAALDLPR